MIFFFLILIKTRGRLLKITTIYDLRFDIALTIKTRSRGLAIQLLPNIIKILTTRVLRK